MRFRLILDPNAEEEVCATVHERSALTDELEGLVVRYTGADRLVGYADEERRLLHFEEVACVFVESGKTYAVTREGERFGLRQRLYEVETVLPGGFLRINKSAIGNVACMERFTVSLAGAVDVIFKGGYRDYVSRRCFADIKRRLLK